MTKARAKEISIEMWTRLAESGDTTDEETRRDFCLLCRCLEDCPLYDCTNYDSPFCKWHYVAKTNEERKQYANEILELIKAWEV